MPDKVILIVMWIFFLIIAVYIIFFMPIKTKAKPRNRRRKSDSGLKYLPWFDPDYQKRKRQTPLFKNRQPDDTGGLPWFGNKKRARKKKKYFWDD